MALSHFEFATLRVWACTSIGFGKPRSHNMIQNRQGVIDGVRQSEQALCFGPYCLSRRHVLYKDGARVPLGRRAVEILLALVERAGQVVAKRELMRRVWGGMAVAEPALRFQVAAVRKALGGHEEQRCYIQTVSGLGYRFVAPVRSAGHFEPVTGEVRQAPWRPAYQPASAPTHLLGRAGLVNLLVGELPAHRLLTLTGPGGIGKTAVAAACAQRLHDTFAQGVSCIDFAPLADASLVPRSVAAALGLPCAGVDPLPDMIAFLQSRNMLLVLDTCDHVLDSAAHLAEAVLQFAPRVCIIATSREALRARGEWVRRLPPLPVPPAEGHLTATDLLTWPSVELLLERASAAVEGFELVDADVPAIVELCGKLDGIPLAIELAAAHLGVFGVRGLSSGMPQWLRLPADKRFAVEPRHASLWAALEWSYRLLSREQQAILRRLSVLACAFSERDAQVMTSGPGIRTGAVADALASLVAKSLITADLRGPEVSFRLLEIVRIHARSRLTLSPGA